MTYTDPIDDNVVPLTAGAGSGVGRIQRAAAARDDISGHLTEQDLAELGANVVADWERDKASNQVWRKKAEEALEAAAQEDTEPKDYPWPGAANVQYPLLTVSAIQFDARAYPAIVKGDEAIKFKTFGRDPQGEKAKRAKRRAEYMNWKLFYGVENWEADTDGMLLRLPIVGQHFRKVYWDPIERRPCIDSISALRLTIPADARSLETSPRITHDFDRYPYELKQLMAGKHYRTIKLDIPAPAKEGEQTPAEPTDEQSQRLILEQHRMMDLDEDGLEEPYVVTVDFGSAQVLRIEEAFDEDGLTYDGEGPDASVTKIQREQYFVEYPFIPDPKGGPYAIGFGHLLAPIMASVNTAINMMLDAGHAQVAGGGFIGAEIRLQGAGQTPVLRFQPGEYKTVNATGDDIRKAIFERTFPEPSPVLFQLLGMLMEAAKDVASVNDAITGDAARTAPVGTTLALIEQGQQVFNAIYKRVYRSLRKEFQLFSDCLRKYGDAAEYARFCDMDEPEGMLGHNGGPPMQDEGLAGAMGQGGLLPQMAPQQQPTDPAELFKADFNDEDLDIRPVSDPSAVTKAQVLAKDQFALAFLGKGMFADDRAVVRQALLDAGVEQAEEWIPETPPAPPQPTPLQIQDMALTAHLKEAKATRDQSAAVLDAAKAAEIARKNSGAPAAAAVALDHAKAQHLLAGAAQTAAGLLPSLEAGEPAPIAKAPAPVLP